MSEEEKRMRLAQIISEEEKMAYEEWRYGIKPDKQYSAKLFSEKLKLMK